MPDRPQRSPTQVIDKRSLLADWAPIALKWLAVGTFFHTSARIEPRHRHRRDDQRELIEFFCVGRQRGDARWRIFRRRLIDASSATGAPRSVASSMRASRHCGGSSPESNRLSLREPGRARVDQRQRVDRARSSPLTTMR